MRALPHEHARIDRIEALLHEDVGRNVTALMAATRGALARAAFGLAEARSVGIVTGFFVPGGEIPAAETDGPAGAALLARGLTRLGVPCRLLTDASCRDACAVALEAAGALSVPVDVVTTTHDTDTALKTWRGAGIDWAVAIERCGRTADGTLRNMRGHDIGAHAVPLDDVFSGGPWRTVAIGDGGNEIGMGALPPGLIAAHVAHGARIACVTPADHLVMAGVSHWGAWGLIAALAAARADWRTELLECLDPALDRLVLEAMVAHGPAVDGVSLRRVATIDSLDLDTHHRKLAEIMAAVG